MALPMIPIVPENVKSKGITDYMAKMNFDSIPEKVSSRNAFKEGIKFAERYFKKPYDPDEDEDDSSDWKNG